MLYNAAMKKLIEKAKKNHSLTKNELIQILNNSEINNELFSAADEVRKEFLGDEIHLRALIEFSNYCKCN